MIDYYKLLEISEDASIEVVKAAYRALAKKYHPDTYTGSANEQEKNMAQLNEAYEVLSDDCRRHEYDLRLQQEKSRSTPESFDGNNYDDNSSHEHSSKESAYNSNSYPEGRTKSKFAMFLHSIGKEITDSIQRNIQEQNNAYVDGCLMDARTLVKHFRQANGFKRNGYAKALEEMGLLIRDCEGNLKPTDEFRHYL